VATAQAFPVLGGCCINGNACAVATQADCEAPPPSGAGGCYFGDNTTCPTQNAAIFPEGGGTVFVHVIGPPIDCTTGCTGGVASAQSRAGCTTSGPFTDPWVSPADAQMCHNFGSPDTDPIPADFFGPGSDPFTGTVCLEGVPLGGSFGAADTLIQRSADPFERCAVPGAAQQTVDIEIVQLSLVGVAPITVTFNGGQNPEQWTVAVTVSPDGLLPGTPQGTLTATKTHCNGGTYTANLFVQPQFTFTGPGGTKVLDTFVQGTAAVQLQQVTARPWISEVDPLLGLQGDPCTFFHPNVDDSVQRTLAECDQDMNGVLDICQIPAASEWGLLVLVIGVLAGGSVLLRRRAAGC